MHPSALGPKAKRVFSNFGPRRVAAPRTPDRMAAAAAVVVAQRKRHAAAELAAEEHEAQGGTPRAAMLSPKKVPKKPKKVETKPPLPYQQQVFDFYQNEKIQIFVAVRGPRASRHNCPLSRSPGIRTIVPSTSSRRALTTTAPPHVAPRPHGCSCLLSQTSSSASRRRSTIHILTMCGPIYPRCFCPYLPPPTVHTRVHPASLARADPHIPCPPLDQLLPCDPAPLPPNLQTTPAKPAKCLLLKTLHSTRPIHPPTPTLHAPPPQLKKHPQLWITVTACFNVIFLIELLVNWYGSVWCAATLHPKLESEHQPSS